MLTPKSNADRRPRDVPVVVKMRRRDDIYAKVDNLILPAAFLKRVEMAYGSASGTRSAPARRRDRGTS